MRAHLEDGILTASVVLPHETYHIEPSWRHIPDSMENHMITYRSSDIKLSWHHHHDPATGAPSTCGYVKEGLGEAI